MSKENYFVQKKDYIDKINKAFEPLTDFKCIEYAYEYVTGQEYLKMQDTVGGTRFLDVTGLDHESILIDVMFAVTGQDTDSVIKPKEERRRVAAIFDKGGSLID